jgi:DNA repair exonuclease SbcCD ATPase subunit
MPSTIFRKLAYLPLLALPLTSIASASSAVSVKNSAIAECRATNLTTEASDLLKQIKTLSANLSTDANTLESYKLQPRLSWRSHANELSKAREHINGIGERLDRLQAIKSVAAPWQQRAIDDIVPVAANLAAHTQSAIQHLKENRTHLYAPVYADHLTSISERSAELKASVAAFLEFGDTSNKLDRMQQKFDRLQEGLGLLGS